MNIDYSFIGKQIKSRRRLLGYTQEQLAEALSVSVGYISQIERGATKGSLDTLAKISTVLRCGVTEFLENSVCAQPDYLREDFVQVFCSLPERQKRILLEISRILARES